MRRTPLKRTPMRRGKGTSRYAQRERDIDYMLRVKELQCLLAGLDGAGPCSSVVEADHAGERGMGQKAPDDTCIPLCSRHHVDRHAFTGFFRDREKEWHRDWRARAIEKTRAELCPEAYDS